jgi:hypothetical protein
MLTALNLILCFSAALVLHELGHYIAARICGIPVKEVGIGWGPKLFEHRIGQQLDLHIRLLPLGAYVRMDMSTLVSRSLSQQLFVLGAGIAVNLLLFFLTAGTAFGALNLGLAIGNTLPLYQQDGWKGGIAVCRRIFGQPNPIVEWSLTISGALLGLFIVAKALISLYGQAV